MEYVFQGQGHFTPSATALEGLMGQNTVAQRRGQDYEAEIALETTCGALRVRGRADGYDPRRRCLEEIKTIRGHPDDIPHNRRLGTGIGCACNGAVESS